MFALALFFVAVNSERTDKKLRCPAGIVAADANCECARGARIHNNRCFCYAGNKEPVDNEHCPVI